MCMEWSSFIRVRGSFPREAGEDLAGGVMVRSHDRGCSGPVPGIRRQFPAPVVSMGSPWHPVGKEHSRTQPCRSDRVRLHRTAMQARRPRA